MNFERILDSKMPLSEFYRSIDGNNESPQQKSNDISYIPNDEFVELIWEKGQLMMQGQSSKAKKTPVSSNFQFHTPKIQEKNSILDLQMPEIGLNQDDDMVPWLNYPLDDYCSDLLPEISGVTVNEPRMHKDLHSHTHNKISDVGSNPTSKGSKSSQLFSWSLDQVHNPDPTVRSGGSSVNLEKKLQKQDSQIPYSSSTLLNFSHFSRPAAMAKASLQNREPQKEIGQHGSGSVKVGSNPFASKPIDEPRCVEKSAGNEKSTDGPETVKSNEPVGACSSLCSGNSAERASNDLTKNSKRKSRDTEDFECESQDVEEESLDTKTAGGSRSGVGSKRSRAAEVHNLSERRRRDRINEKMRALQELIPNCNKVDKASMLDEAIEYLKTLQLQVQIMSMGTGLCMPPMMFPSGMQHMHPHFSPMGMNYGMGMGIGMDQGHTNMFPFPQGSRHPPPVYGHPSQRMPMLFPQPPMQGIPAIRQIGSQLQVADGAPRSMDPVIMAHMTTQSQGANKSLNQSTSLDKKDQD